MKKRSEALDGLYEAIQEAYDELCARNPKSELLPLIYFEKGFPEPRPEFERRYRRLIRNNVCTYLEAHQQYLQDLSQAIADTY